MANSDLAQYYTQYSLYLGQVLGVMSGKLNFNPIIHVVGGNKYRLVTRISIDKTN